MKYTSDFTEVLEALELEDPDQPVAPDTGDQVAFEYGNSISRTMTQSFKPT